MPACFLFWAAQGVLFSNEAHTLPPKKKKGGGERNEAGRSGGWTQVGSARAAFPRDKQPA